MESINKCPYCGGNAVVIGRKRIRVVCKRCRAQSPIFGVKSLAISAWNKRDNQKSNIAGE